ncbi:MAG TPA: hypothetical protein VF006_08180 [Longimicrobium sp.]
MSGTSMEPGGNPGGAAGPAAAPAGQQPQNKHLGDHWPTCRCGHPMHPSKIETRRGVRLERFECPRQRWWNSFLHPYVWQPPRE